MTTYILRLDGNIVGSYPSFGSAVSDINRYQKQIGSKDILKVTEVSNRAPKNKGESFRHGGFIITMDDRQKTSKGVFKAP